MNIKNSIFAGLLMALTLCLLPIKVLAISADKVGVYFWDGKTEMGHDNMKAGYLLLKQLGTHSIRITMSPRSDVDYGLGENCIPNFSLVKLAQRSDFHSFFSDPQFSTIMITAYDGITDICSGQNYLDPKLYDATTIFRIKSEYRDLASYLGSNFPNKTFLIGHWEGDNAVYCGSSYDYNNRSCPQSAKNIEGLIRWLNARADGIKMSKSKNVWSVVEFNSVRNLQGRELPSVLNNVIPRVNADYFSYSAYESTSQFDFTDKDVEKIAEDIALIRKILADRGRNPNNLIIGELGFSHGKRKETREKLEKALQTIPDSSVNRVFIWNLLDVGGPYGLFHPYGNETPAGNYVRKLFKRGKRN